MHERHKNATDECTISFGGLPLNPMTKFQSLHYLYQVRFHTQNQSPFQADMRSEMKISLDGTICPIGVNHSQI